MMQAMQLDRFMALQAEAGNLNTSCYRVLNTNFFKAETLFTPPTEETKFTDEAKIGDAMLHQAGEKIKDAFK